MAASGRKAHLQPGDSNWASCSPAWTPSGARPTNPRTSRTCKHAVDQFVQPDGTIDGYDPQAYSLNNILLGRELLVLYRVTHQEKYRLAAQKTLRQQIATQPRTASGGVWHSKATPNLMLLDDQFMLAPFYAEYAATFHEPQDLDDIVKQFTLLEQHTRDRKTGLMYHGWDESRTTPWANKNTGTSANLWARGMGWYLMALVDTLPYVPERDPHHAVLLAMLHRAAAAVEQGTGCAERPVVSDPR